ncbi:NADH-quinone oxidoreductase subunit I [Intrasporangium sp.]|uniref:NuoI/complex I 23 kDa subunit family protein n=1 Tax=Intrasporangium sp. TaxID=1925024 RepID=UPI002939B0BF|nr:NADH-quinone oxidoreductase subunit I [Intrasporangium sp.]MDV3220721.1 NADH-quinone oxidoreductase subunit I [Intrasporangium sp.]
MTDDATIPESTTPEPANPEPNPESTKATQAKGGAAGSRSRRSTTKPDSAPAGPRHASQPSGILPGLVKGLATTARTLTRHTHTAEYPDVPPKLPPRSRGVIALTEENCTSCMLCARECPDWCIYIDSHKEEIPPTTPGGRARQRNVLDRFAIDFSLCMYCGICVEVCPFDALWWSPEFEYAELDIRELLHEKDRLGAWMATVPPPAALDPASADPAELVASAKPPRPPRPASGEGGPPATRVRRADRGAPEEGGA